MSLWPSFGRECKAGLYTWAERTVRTGPQDWGWGQCPGTGSQTRTVLSNQRYLAFSDFHRLESGEEIRAETGGLGKLPGRGTVPRGWKGNPQE